MTHLNKLQVTLNLEEVFNGLGIAIAETDMENAVDEINSVIFDYLMDYTTDILTMNGICYVNVVDTLEDLEAGHANE